MERKKSIRLLILCLCCCLSVCAQQRLFVSSTSATYPYERGQWTRAEGLAWTQQYGPIIGVNCPYPPHSAISQKDAIRKAHELGFNSVRWWPSGSSASDYIRSVEQWAEWADEYGMTVAPVFGFVYTYFGYKDKAAGLKQLEAVVRPIIRHFRNDRRVILWDIWNEPEMDNPEICVQQMDWIKQMVVWCRQEGCTQAITSSIIWDAGIGAATLTTLRQRRNEAEAMMDLHNYHDYSVQEDHNRNTSVMVDRIGKIDDRPLVCTECLTRTNGSGVARTLSEFAKYHINFYTWGLYTCDANWEVKWGASTYYAWEPMFHNLLYADGEPYNPSELEWIKNFKFADEGQVTDPGAEYTERWTERRAWKWMNRDATRGLQAATVSQAESLIQAHATDGLYNSIGVRLNYTDFIANKAGFYEAVDALLQKADTAGMTVLPTLLNETDMARGTAPICNYVYEVMGHYYHDARVLGWNIFEQQSTAATPNLDSFLSTLFRFVRYQFPNQPIFATPLVQASTEIDTLSSAGCNLMWKLSDVTAFALTGGASPADAWLQTLDAAYRRPLFCMSAAQLPQSYADCHVNWFNGGSLTPSEVASFHFATQTARPESAARWQAWQAWKWMNRSALKGWSFSSVSSALTKLQSLEPESTPFNSIHVQLDYAAFLADSAAFYANFDQLLAEADQLGMTVLPSLLNDKYGSRTDDLLTAYVTALLNRYAQDGRVLLWDLYYHPGSSYTNQIKLTALIETLFAAARNVRPLQPLIMTPTVSTTTFADDFDYVDVLVHGGTSGGWNKLIYGVGSSVAMCSRIWDLSDVIAYTSAQKAGELGWLNSVAYRYGRPLFCTDWKPVTAEGPNKSLAVFSDMHVNWFVNGTSVSDEVAKNFHFVPVITTH